ncbi:MAG: GNAT family N-acetyltransferase, partial [Phycisphaerales bacterium]|nr:GNAT family N-acetyltransferase [Phycisphaerales bacterium]
RAFLNWAFDTTPVIRIQAHHRTVNLASGRVLQKIGMEREGLMRQRALVNDEPADIVYYSALKEKWPPSAPPEPQSLGLEAMPLTTDRLVLRPITMDDVEVMHQLWCSPGVFEGLASIPRQPDMAFARGRVANMYERIASGLCLNLLASLGSPEGEVIGEIGISVSWRHRKGELGYLLDERYRGQGYASEILQAMAEHAFGPMGLHRLQAGIYPENTASGRLLERHGFTPEGFTRGAFRKEGEYLDGLEWSLLVTDPRPWQDQAD